MKRIVGYVAIAEVEEQRAPGSDMRDEKKAV
jgi:hypothetical protein